MNEQIDKNKVMEYVYKLVTKENSGYSNLIDIKESNNSILINKLKECLMEIVDEDVIPYIDPDYEFEDQVYDMVNYQSNPNLIESLDSLNSTLHCY